MQSDQTDTVEYLQSPTSTWGLEVKREILDPVREEMLRHPFIVAARDGSLTLERCIVYAAETLYQIVGFPSQMASLAARCPRYEHETKRKLLKNAFSEHNHPHMLAQFIEAAGYNPGSLLHGPRHGYEPLLTSRRTCDENDLYAFHRPWLVGLAAITAGAETCVPLQVECIRRVITEVHGFSGRDVQWFDVHSGEVEIEHANEGLANVDHHLEYEDDEMRTECRDAIRAVSQRVAIDTIDEYWSVEPERVLAQLRN